MKKVSILLLSFLFASLQLLHAQNKEVSGTVTSSEDGQPIPGVAVIATGTNVGITTDIDGNFELNVPASATSLTFSFVGMADKVVEIGGQTVINVVLDPSFVGLDEVVVTALGISREKKSLGYSVQEVSADDLTPGGETNILNALSGKVAGLQISSSSGNIGGSSRVLIRGASSILGENQPLYIVDGIPLDNSNFNNSTQTRGAGGYDYGNLAQDINPDDIETISVLKGASATALYGSRASNGVIIITTKKGEMGSNKGIGVSINSGVTFEQVSVLPDYQNTYGGGYYGYFDTVNVSGTDYLIPYYGADESWGPKMEGQEVLHWWGLYDYEQGITSTPETAPWEANPDNLRNYFETGVTYRNNISLSGGTEVSAFRLSYTNLNKTGVFPNSKLDRNSINFSGQTKLGQRLTASAVANYIKTDNTGIPANGYGDNSIMQKFAQWGQRQWDMDKMSNYKNPDGTQRTWNRRSFSNPRPAYSDNPYWTQYENYADSFRDRFYGTVKLNYSIFEWLSLSGALSTDYFTDRKTERTAASSAAVSYFNEYVREGQETNMDLMLNFNHNFGADFSLTGFVGANNRYYNYQRNIGYTNGGLSVPGFYSLENSNSPITVDDYTYEKEVQSLLGSVSVGYQDMLFLDVTARNDWSSTLPSDAWSFFYPSATASFVFSELVNAPLLDFGKVRLGWAQVGNDTDPYSLNPTLLPYDNFGTYPRFGLPESLNNPYLEPEFTTEIEFGLEMAMLQNRIGLDLSIYDKETENQLIPVDISPSSGYSAQRVNAGTISNKGVEVLLNLTPVRTQDFSWDITVNYAKNINEVVELREGVDNINISSLWSVYVTARKGEPYGMLRGSGYVRDDQERIVVDEDGYLLTSSDVVELGSVLPDWIGGLRNSFTYKGVNLAFLVDVRKGGHLFSTTHMFGTWTGLFEETAGNNDKGNPLRDPVSQGGGFRYADAVVGHIDDDGNVVVDSETNENYIDAYDWASGHYFGPRERNVFKTDYFKLREISLGYSLPASVISNTPFTGVTLSAFGRNLALWGTKVPHIDPEHSTNAGNVQGLEGASNPSTRSFGLNVKLDF